MLVLSTYVRILIILSNLVWIVYATLLSLSYIELDFIQNICFWLLIILHWWLVINYRFVKKFFNNGDIQKYDKFITIFNISYRLTIIVTLILNYKIIFNYYSMLSSLGAFVIYKIFNRFYIMDRIVQACKK